MTWTKLSDDFADDCWTLSDAAFRLHVEGLTWSNRKLLDLELPKEDVRRFKRPEAVRELVDGGWWRDAGDCYVIQHHSTYQRARAAVIAQQTANAENGRKGGRPRKPPRETFTPESESVSESVSEVNRQGAVEDPVSTLTETESVSESRTERDRTGQGSKTEELPTAADAADGGGWPTVRRCLVCQGPLDKKLPDETHPTCVDAA